MYATNGYRRRKVAPDYYHLLGVPREATFQQIQSAYWKLAYQSDRGIDLAELNEAYEVLGDEKRRREYDDRLGRSG